MSWNSRFRPSGSYLPVRTGVFRAFFGAHRRSLNNNTPLHVIQALLGHAIIDTVMVYAKLYPRNFGRGISRAVPVSSAVSRPKEPEKPAEEWVDFEVSCSICDMGTHLCGLPTSEHCPRGLVCLGCVHAQPKKSTTSVRRTIVSHERGLAPRGG